MKTSGEAFKDNVVLDYAGIRGTELTPAQKRQLLTIIENYISNMKEGHAKVKMDEVRQQISDTYFAWIGGTGPDSVFYYRIQSPVFFDRVRPSATCRSPSGGRGPKDSEP